MGMAFKETLKNHLNKREAQPKKDTICGTNIIIKTKA